MRASHARPLIIARTDAVAVEGFDRAVERAALYRDAGADMLFVEAPREREELARVVAKIGRAAPLMANMVEGGKTPMLSGGGVGKAWFCLGHLSRRDRARPRQNGGRFLRLAEGARHHRAVPRAHADFDALNGLIGTPEMLALGKRYEVSASVE